VIKKKEAVERIKVRSKRMGRIRVTIERRNERMKLKSEIRNKGWNRN
jgi:hypothetical protein